MPGSTRKSTSPKRSPRLAGPSPDDYQMVLLWSKDDHCYVVTLPAWQNARTHGKTLQEATRNAREVLEMLIESAVRHGEPIPPPNAGTPATCACGCPCHSTGAWRAKPNGKVSASISGS